MFVDIFKTDKKYQTIYVDPPWGQQMYGTYKRRPKTATHLRYPTMTIDGIRQLPIRAIAEIGCHLWLWTTNQFLSMGFEILKAWGFKYLAPVTWVKPSGTGNYFIHRTQTLLFGYKDKCYFPLGRYKPTVVFTSIPKRHSQKPNEFYEFIENISPPPRIELFARQQVEDWDTWGNEVS